MLYNKFNVTSSSPPDNPPLHPNSDYNCVVATCTTGQWRVSRCDEPHPVVCQSDYDTLTGIMTTCLHNVIFTNTFTLVFLVSLLVFKRCEKLCIWPVVYRLQSSLADLQLGFLLRCGVAMPTYFVGLLTNRQTTKHLWARPRVIQPTAGELAAQE